MSYSYLGKVADTPTCLRPKTKKIAGSSACPAAVDRRWF